jgi:hypothetical protein
VIEPGSTPIAGRADVFQAVAATGQASTTTAMVLRITAA